MRFTHLRHIYFAIKNGNRELTKLSNCEWCPEQENHNAIEKCSLIILSDDTWRYFPILTYFARVHIRYTRYWAYFPIFLRPIQKQIYYGLIAARAWGLKKHHTMDKMYQMMVFDILQICSPQCLKTVFQYYNAIIRIWKRNECKE